MSDTDPATGESVPDDQTQQAPRRRVRTKLEQTRDDTDRGWGERPDEDAHERWLQEQRPPHWE